MTSRKTNGVLCAFCERVCIWPTINSAGYGEWQERNGRQHYSQCLEWQRATDWAPDEQPLNVPTQRSRRVVTV